MDPSQDPADVTRKARAYCRLNFPARWTAGTPTWDATRGRWLIPVLLEGRTSELGQLAFDGETMRLVTPLQTMLHRARGSTEEPST